MKRIICAAMVIAMLSACAVAEDTVIHVENVQAVSMGDESNEIEASEGEDVSSLEDTADETGNSASDPAELIDRVAFEEGFSILLPEGWLYYPIDKNMADTGVYHALSSADGTRQIYIQLWDTDCATIEDLETMICNTTSPVTTGIHDFNGTPFLVYDLPEDGISCASTMWEGRILNIVFYPQSDVGYMLTAAGIMQSFSAAY